MRILIIEDENRTAQDLQSTLEELDPAIEVQAIRDSVDGAVTWLKANPLPDLIFMDIQLADGLSFEIFQEVAIECPVVFCTAYDEYAVEAFKVNGVDYILKPFDRDSIARALTKVKNLQNFFQRGNLGLNKLADLLNTLKPAYRSSFLVSHRDKLLPVSVQEIAFFYIEHEVTFLHTFDGKRYVVNHTMDELEKQLDPKHFYRANRQFLMNYSNVVEVEHYFARKLLIKTKAPTKEPVIVSKAKATDFLTWMETR
jgi:DNA-binding LytR/AlgR family response regulator